MVVVVASIVFAQQCHPESILGCGDVVVDDSDGPGSFDQMVEYGCSPGMELFGNERSYELVVGVDQRVRLELSDLNADLDLIAMEGSTCAVNACIDASVNPYDESERLELWLGAGEPVIVVVDGYHGASSAFTLRVECPDSPGDTGSPTGETGRSDTGRSDTGRSDTGQRDTGRSDTGRSDTGQRDTGRSDTGQRDTGRSDTGRSDTGRSDTGRSDTGRSDTGQRDTGRSDTGGRSDPTGTASGPDTEPFDQVGNAFACGCSSAGAPSALLPLLLALGRRRSRPAC